MLLEFHRRIQHSSNQKKLETDTFMYMISVSILLGIKTSEQTNIKRYVEPEGRAVKWIAFMALKLDMMTIKAAKFECLCS